MYIYGINHVTLQVRDLAMSDYFYTEVLGLRRVGQRPNMHFYSSGRFAHELALIQVPEFVRSADDGLVHLCFNVPTEEALYALYRHCQALKVLTSGGVDHTVMHSFYLRDPDGYIIEMGTDRPAREWEHHAHPFAKDRPLNLKRAGGPE